MSHALTITTAAKDRILSRRSADTQAYLQVIVEGGGCSGFQYKMSWLDAIPDDAVIIDDVVVSDALSLPYLSGATLDFAKTLMGEDFSIKNPNATSSCGCGTSFSVG